MMMMDLSGYIFSNYLSNPYFKGARALRIGWIECLILFLTEKINFIDFDYHYHDIESKLLKIIK